MTPTLTIAEQLRRAHQANLREKLSDEHRARQVREAHEKAKQRELDLPSDGIHPDKRRELQALTKSHQHLLDKLREQQRLAAAAEQAKTRMGIGDVVPRHEDGVLLPEHRIMSVAEQLEREEASPKPTPATTIKGRTVRNVKPPAVVKAAPVMVAAPAQPQRPPPVVAAAEFDLDRDLKAIAQMFGPKS